MPEALIRILRPDGTLEPGQTPPDIPDRDLLRLYRTMLLNRRVDERMTMLQRQGRIGFYIGSIGEEASILGSAYALRDQDWIIPCYRELGAALLRGFSLDDLCCQLFSNADDRVKGRQMPNHYAAADLRFGSISSPVGSQIPHATGIGLAARLLGSDEIVLVYFGDGATSEGDFHVALNFAGVYKAATVFLCRNNQWAISVPESGQTASESLAIKATAYGMEGVRVDGNDILAVCSVTREAARRARSGEGPTLIEAYTYRRGAHSTSDDPRAYRSEDEVEPWLDRDPLKRLKIYLVSRQMWSEDEDSALDAKLNGEIQEALSRAERTGPPPLNTMFEDVLDTMPWHLQEQFQELERSLQKESQPVSRTGS